MWLKIKHGERVIDLIMVRLRCVIFVVGGVSSDPWSLFRFEVGLATRYLKTFYCKFGTE